MTILDQWPMLCARDLAFTHWIVFGFNYPNLVSYGGSHDSYTSRDLRQWLETGFSEAEKPRLEQRYRQLF